ncbi:MAG TPA: hypothetical protein VG944_04735 [Fimbriimonas sp.]|nr:hypothetical protein [Fimbriimonas sp.]
MKALAGNAALEASDRDYVEQKLDELLDGLYKRAQGDDERFSEMLAHFVAMTVAPSLAATNMVLRMPCVSARTEDQPVRVTIAGEPSYVNNLQEFEADLAEAVTNAVLQTILGPSPRIPALEATEPAEELFLN